jgi:hypothetical protein
MADPLITPVIVGPAVKTGAEVAKGVIPWIVNKGKMWWYGKQIIVVGPKRTGKTSFLDYLELGILRAEQRTGRTLQLDLRENFVIELGKDLRLKIRVRKPFDSPGDIHPSKQVEYIERQRHHGIIIILDATKFKTLAVNPGLSELTDESSIGWLTEFCVHLNNLLHRDKKVTQSLKTMIVVMNKWDKLEKVDEDSDKRRKEEFEQDVRSVLDEHLNNNFYSKDGPRIISVFPCALVNSPLSDLLVKEVINTLALSLR